MVSDPWASPEESQKYYNITLENFDSLSNFDGVIGAVSHEKFVSLSAEELGNLVSPGGLIVDIKNMWKADQIPSEREFFTL